MPRRLSAESLKCIVMKFICDSFEVVVYGCDASYMNFKRGNYGGEYLKVLTPLGALPSSLANDLCEKVLWTRWAHPHILHGVIAGNLTRCEIPTRLSSSVPLAVNLLSKRSPHLHTFQLNICKGIDAQAFHPLLQSATRLRHLNVEGTSFDNSCIEVLARNNSELVSLNITRTNVTDEGWNCVTQNTWRKLTALSMEGLQMKPECILNLLFMIPSLQNLESEKLVQALHLLKVKRDVFHSSQEMKFQIKMLSLSGCVEEDCDVLSSVMSSFPHLQHLILENSEISPTFFDCLTRAQPVQAGQTMPAASFSSNAGQTLHVDQQLVPNTVILPAEGVQHQALSDSSDIKHCDVYSDFDSSHCYQQRKTNTDSGESNNQLSSIEPKPMDISTLEIGFNRPSACSALFNTLQVLGSRLTKLSLECVDDCDFSIVGQFCTNLRSFRLSAFLTSCYTQYRPKTFTNLEHLTIFNSRSARMERKVIKSMMGPAIKSIVLQDIDELDDSLFLEILLENKLTFLQDLSLEDSNRFTVMPLLRLLAENNDLGSLQIWCCQGIKGNDQNLIRQYISRNMLDVNFQWQGMETPLGAGENPVLLRDVLLPLLGVRIFQDN